MEKVETIQRISILQISIHKFKFENTCIVKNSDEGVLHFGVHVPGLSPPPRSKKKKKRQNFPESELFPSSVWRVGSHLMRWAWHNKLFSQADNRYETEYNAVYGFLMYRNPNTRMDCHLLGHNTVWLGRRLLRWWWNLRASSSGQLW
jgi:hypothetical protein